MLVLERWDREITWDEKWRGRGRGVSEKVGVSWERVRKGRKEKEGKRKIDGDSLRERGG